jgi:hypothetical protein
LSSYKPEHLAKEADRLIHDEILGHAINEAKQDALEKLAVIDPTDSVGIIKQQQLILALEDITNTLERYILAQV